MTKKVSIAALVLTVMLIGSTQFVAHRMAYAERLGKPLVTLSSVKLYPPWYVLVWHQKFGATHRQVFTLALVAPCLVLGLVAVARLRHLPDVKPVGRHRWGGLLDLKRAGLLGRVGVVVGRFGRRVLRFRGPGHVLVIGGSRSGKTMGVVVPTLLSWPKSVVVFDPKGELWNLTAGFRSQFSHCVRFNATREDSLGWNPLLEVRRGHEVRDAQNIASVLADPAGEKNQPDIWDLSASQLVTALILHVLYTAEDDRKHLGTVRDLLLDSESMCVRMLTTPHRVCPESGVPQVHPEVAMVAKGLLTAPERFRGSVVATAESYLTLFADPTVRRSVSRSDLNVGDLMCGDRPVSLYLQAPPSDAGRLKPLTRLRLNQVARGLMEDEQHDPMGRPKRHTLLLLLEEFASFGRLPFFEQQLRQMASYGIQTLLVTQAFSDLLQQYGTYQSLVENCQVIVTFAANDTLTQSRVSQMTGQSMEYREGYSRPKATTGWARQTVNLSEQVRPLLQPGEVRQLPPDEQLVFVTGFKPFKTKKLSYYKDTQFKRRVMDPPDPSDGRIGLSPTRSPWLGERAKGPSVPLDLPDTAHPEEDLTGELSLDPLDGLDESTDEDRFAL